MLKSDYLGPPVLLTSVNGLDWPETVEIEIVTRQIGVNYENIFVDKDQRCEVTGEDYRCVCRQGYQKQHDNNVPPICEDVDECRTTKDICTNKDDVGEQLVWFIV